MDAICLTTEPRSYIIKKLLLFPYLMTLCLCVLYRLVALAQAGHCGLETEAKIEVAIHCTKSHLVKCVYRVSSMLISSLSRDLRNE